MPEAMRSVGDLAPQELMAYVLSKELRNGEIGATGISSVVPLAAIILARNLHAPGLIMGGEPIYNSKPRAVSRGLDDHSLLERAEAVEGFWELFGHWHRGLDFFFFSGLEIDRFGNLNVHYVGGEFHKPEFRGPGVPNVSLAARCRRSILFSTRHEPRRFVESVDFVSMPGHHISGFEGPETATRQGPVVCVTPICVMDFKTPDKRMRLKSVHPWSSVEEVVSRTGFELQVQDVEVTPLPTADELATLRQKVDPFGVLRGNKVH